MKNEWIKTAAEIHAANDTGAPISIGQDHHDIPAFKPGSADAQEYLDDIRNDFYAVSALLCDDVISRFVDLTKTSAASDFLIANGSEFGQEARRRLSSIDGFQRRLAFVWPKWEPLMKQACFDSVRNAREESSTSALRICIEAVDSFLDAHRQLLFENIDGAVEFAEVRSLDHFANPESMLYHGIIGGMQFIRRIVEIYPILMAMHSITMGPEEVADRLSQSLFVRSVARLSGAQASAADRILNGCAPACYSHTLDQQAGGPHEYDLHHVFGSNIPQFIIHHVTRGWFDPAVLSLNSEFDLTTTIPLETA